MKQKNISSKSCGSIIISHRWPVIQLISYSLSILYLLMKIPSSDQVIRWKKRLLLKFQEIWSLASNEEDNSFPVACNLDWYLYSISFVSLVLLEEILFTYLWVVHYFHFLALLKIGLLPRFQMKTKEIL